MSESRAFLVKIMAERKIHPSQLYKDLAVSPSLISNWLRGINKIYPKYARVLGRYFGVGPENFLEDWYKIDPNDKSFGTELRRRRLRMGFSLMELSFHIGYCDNTLCNWEHNKYRKKQKDDILMLFESVESNLSKIV